MEQKLQTINRSIENWQFITNDLKLQTIRSLKSIATISTCQISKDLEMSCPEHGHQISSPCNLSECNFYIGNPKSFNCVYHSLDNSKKKKLTPNEISSCLGMTVSQVNNHIFSAIQKIRFVKIEDDMSSNRINKFSYISGCCINCGTNIEDELDLGIHPNLIIEHGKYGYCSDSCKKSKMPWKFKLENKYNTDWEYVVIKISEYINNIKATSKEIEGLLGINPFDLCDKDKQSLSRYKELYFT